MTDAPNLNRLRYFTATVDAGSFTRAAERLGVAKTVVSHQVARLEEELRVTLLKRTTRKLHLTEAGRRFHERASVILRDADDAFGEAALGLETPTGTLTVTAPSDYGRTVVAPAIAEFLSRFPGLRADVTFDDAIVDLIDTEVEVAIRLGWLADSGLQMRRLGSFRQLLVCTPALAARATRLTNPHELRDMSWIGNRLLRHPLDWTFTNDGVDDRVVGQPTIMADKTPAAHACVLAGGGLSVLPDFVVASDIAAGRLVHLMPAWSLPEGGIYAVYPEARFRSARVRHFVDLLRDMEYRRSHRDAPLVR
ncbi:LysR family transcriptional regulator [Agrobacterium sp. SORGH_AS 787]|uniref:LysR family transcriptional regulator n=1 Tax=Agrobacterium sp. SORGH_AS 787 TaxID=3041775 RepID=UPI002780F5B4|nr:DNA-binding transcriptional LysR family regulator [Rhizobium sp. SORGH_AS_0787]